MKTLSPEKVRLDAATICQLKCPSCPTAAGKIEKGIGSGFLKFDDFKSFIDSTPAVRSVEISNWGEVFLNPQLYSILEYAFEKNVEITIDNGANLNNVRSDVLEALVKFRVANIRCSIDGLTQSVYAEYRVNGNIDNVLGNIRAINEYKKVYQSPFPKLTWQFVVFGHNLDEAEQARALAEDLDMIFEPKMQWDDLYDAPVSPVSNAVKEKLNWEVATRAEHKTLYGVTSLQKSSCAQLWNTPQINFDGEMLGCCVNYWGSFGNVFKDGFDSVYNGERMQHAKLMLEGKVQAREDVPCTTCKYYTDIKESKSWMRPSDLGISTTLDHFKAFMRKSMPQPVRAVIRRTLSTVKKIAAN